jgi:hypothetical protein
MLPALCSVNVPSRIYPAMNWLMARKTPYRWAMSRGVNV